MSRALWLSCALVSASGFAWACSAGGDGGSPNGGDGGSGGGSGGNGGSILVGGGGGQGNAGTTCATDPNVDDDMDGYSDNDGDCNDCDPNVSPGAIEVAITEPDENGVIPEAGDEDCDGMIDNLAPPCDDNINFDDTDPMNGAKAVGICRDAADGGWGVISAQYTRADGTPVPGGSVHHGVLDSFGPNVNPQEGTRLLAISSGTARLPAQPGYVNHGSSALGTGTAPPGFPQDVPSCAGSPNINDDIALDLSIRAPTNATGYAFSFKFYSNEFPEYVCTSFNDQFIALVDPAPMGSINGNISFDSAGNPVSVNIAFFDVCNPSDIGNFAAYCLSATCPSPPNPFCPAGTAELQGTGLVTDLDGDQGGTSWLQTTAPIAGGEEFSIRFAIWDTGDTGWDSTTLVDGFEWIASGGVGVGTVPVPTPK